MSADIMHVLYVQSHVSVTEYSVSVCLCGLWITVIILKASGTDLAA